MNMTTLRGTSTAATRRLGFATLAALVFLVLSGLFFSAEDVVQGDSVRIMYVHVPSIWVAYVGFFLSAFCSAIYLSKRGRSLVWDRIAGASAEIGVLFVAVSLVTGSLWGRLTWSKYWVWDARLTSTAFLFITYVGYLAVRRLGGTFDQRARRSAVVALLGVLEIPLVHFSVRLWNTLHQSASIADPNAKVQMDGYMLFTLFWGVVTFSAMFAWLLLHRQRVMVLEDVRDARGLDRAISERRSEAGVK